jgi:transposase-like protein
MVALSCPHCGNKKDVIKFGTNRSGTARCRCLAQGCGRTFTPAPKSRSLTPEKEAAIARALAERVSQQGIARMLKVGRDTVRKVRKKRHSV